MKFRVERDALADAVAWTAKSLPSRPSVPVLAGVLLRVADSRLQVSGFDYEVSSQVTVEVQADADGAALVSGRLLAEITKSLPALPIDVAAVGSHVELTCGSARFTLPTMPVEDYPTLPDMPATAGTVDAADVRRRRAAGRHRGRPGRHAAGAHRRPARARPAARSRMLATDRYRLAIRDLEWRPDDPDAEPGRAGAGPHPARHREDARPAGRRGHRGAVPRRHRRGHDRLRRRHPAYHVAGCSTASSRRSGRCCPTPTTRRPGCPSSALTEVVKRVALVAERATPVRLSFGDDGLVVEAGGSEDARASEAMDCEYTGEPMTIAFNHQYLLDGLAALDGPVAVLSVHRAEEAGNHLARREKMGRSSSSYRYLIMPVRIGG